MKNQLPLLGVLAVLGFGGPLAAETAQPSVQDCLSAQSTQKVSTACLALRVDYRAKVSACMVERRIYAKRSHAAMNTRNSHGYKARHVLCSREVRDSLMMAGN